jgi:hypothetical protein
MLQIFHLKSMAYLSLSLRHPASRFTGFPTALDTKQDALRSFSEVGLSTWFMFV